MLKDYLHKMDIVLLILMVAGLVYVVNCMIEIFNHRKRMKTQVLPHTKSMIILSINRELYAMFEVLTPMIFAIIIKLISWGWVDKL